MRGRPRPQRIPLPLPTAAGRALSYRLPNSPAALAAMAGWLEGADQRAARHYRQPARRRAHLLAAALLRFTVSEALGVTALRPQLQRRRQRRPRLLDGRWNRPLSLSVSHNEDWVWVGVLPGRQRLGLDLEAATRPMAAKLAQRMPWPEPCPSARALLARWTLLEAALKAQGRGLAALSSLQLAGGEESWVQHFTLPGWRISAARVALAGQPRSLGAVAVARPEGRFRVP